MNSQGLTSATATRYGEIARKHGNTSVRRLREIYGHSFAKEFPDTALLSEVLSALDVSSPWQIHAL